MACGSDEVEFQKLESQSLLRLSNGGKRFRGRGEGTSLSPFFHGKKPPTWSLRELLQHVEGKSCPGNGRSTLKHSVLAKYILTNSTMAHVHELSEVNDCSSNKTVKA